MARGRRRKCKCCLKLFRPDPCNRRHQRYCSAPRCRRASRSASQARWLGTENQRYFRDPWHAARVHAWRSRNPGYWRSAGQLGYKTSQRHNPLILHAKQTISCDHRYKIA
jgi:hypothetical protein